MSIKINKRTHSAADYIKKLFITPKKEHRITTWSHNLIMTAHLFCLWPQIYNPNSKHKIVLITRHTNTHFHIIYIEREGKNP